MISAMEGGVIRENHHLIGDDCVLCGQPFEAGENWRFVLGGPLDSDNLAKLKTGSSYTAPATIAHAYGCCRGPMTLKCSCCGFEDKFDDLEQAFADGWDEPNHLSTWPVSCPLCPGVASLGLIDHTAAHERWEREGRPKDYAASAKQGDVPDV